jgi:DNA-binding PadR family transcriptional regulator
MHDLTGFQRDLLYVVASRDSTYGLNIKRILEEYYGSEVNHGRLYPNLNELVEKGLVEKGTIDKRTNSYSLTTRGERELLARRKWEDETLGLADDLSDLPADLKQTT